MINQSRNVQAVAQFNAQVIEVFAAGKMERELYGGDCLEFVSYGNLKFRYFTRRYGPCIGNGISTRYVVPFWA